jgi:hypothetical protein
MASLHLLVPRQFSPERQLVVAVKECELPNLSKLDDAAKNLPW